MRTIAICYDKKYFRILQLEPEVKLLAFQHESELSVSDNLLNRHIKTRKAVIFGPMWTPVLEEIITTVREVYNIFVLLKLIPHCYAEITW